MNFQHLLDALPAAAYTCDRNGLITYFNKRAAELWGRTPRLNDPTERYGGAPRIFAGDGGELSHDLDIGLPKLYGYDVAKRIREARGKDVLLIAITGWGQEEDRRRAFEAGFDHHLTKPVQFEPLLRLIAKSLRAS